MKERVYISTTEFLRKYLNKDFYCTSSGYRVEGNLLWFDIEEIGGFNKAFSNKEPFFTRQEIVFFNASNVQEPFKITMFSEVGKISFSKSKSSLDTFEVKYESGKVVSFKSDKIGIKDYNVKILYQNTPKQCDLCGKDMLSFEDGGGACPHCNWQQNTLSLESPNRVMYPNVISFNKAKELYKNGKPLIPDFEDFIEMFMFYGEVEFWYKGVNYGVYRINNELGRAYGNSQIENYTFDNPDEFAKNATTFDGKLLKDVWHEVENANWLQ